MAIIDFTEPGCWLGDVSWNYDALIIHAERMANQGTTDVRIDESVKDMLYTRDMLAETLTDESNAPYGYRALMRCITRAADTHGPLWPHLSSEARSRLLATVAAA